MQSGPYHIATYAYDQLYGQGRAVSAATVNELLSYAQGDAKALNDCHSSTHQCKAVDYFRPYATVNTSPSSCVEQPDAKVMQAATSESWFLHDVGYSDSAHRVYGTDKDGCKMWSMNPNSAALQSWWNNYLQTTGSQYDLFYIDMSPMDLVDATSFTSGGGCLPNPSYCHSTQEIANDPDLVAAHVGFVNALTYPGGAPMYFIYQQAYPSRTLEDDLEAFASTNRYVGVTCEGCLAEIPPGPVVNRSNYAPYLDEMAAVNATSASFLVMSKGNYSAGSANQVLQRLVTTAVVWLGYSEGHTIVQPDLENNTNNLAVWPEDLIYPSGPLQTMATGASDLQVSSGVYRREFATCYQRGLSFGRCAAIVNSNGSRVTVQSAWLGKTYSHVITISGGDVNAGGKASVTSTTFKPGTTTIQAGGAILLAQ